MADSADLRTLLAHAASAVEVVRIVYRGGSQPGSAREIAPLSISGTDVVALDLATGLNKTFSIAKIELPDAALSTLAYDPQRPFDTRSVHQAVEPNLAALRALGWHIELTDDAASLHRFFKNGKPRRTPDVQFTYD